MNSNSLKYLSHLVAAMALISATLVPRASLGQEHAALVGKSVEYKVEIIDRKNNKTYVMSPKVRISKDGNVFRFITEKDKGHIYKLNQTIDFLADRSRANPDAFDYYGSFSYWTGTSAFAKRTLTLSTRSKAKVKSTGEEVTQDDFQEIAFSSDFTNCSIKRFSLNRTQAGVPSESTLNREIQCAVK